MIDDLHDAVPDCSASSNLDSRMENAEVTAGTREPQEAIDKEHDMPS